MKNYQKLLKLCKKNKWDVRIRIQTEKQMIDLEVEAPISKSMFYQHDLDLDEMCEFALQEIYEELEECGQ